MPGVNRYGFIVQVMVRGSEEPAGVGFVVGHRRILTCAHVVNVALGRQDAYAQERPTQREQVRVKFIFLDGLPVRDCAVQVWEPPSEGEVGIGDIAGLVIARESLPAGTPITRLGDPPQAANVPVKLFGFPGKPSRPDGAWAECDIRGRVREGLLQLDTRLESANTVRLGFSGAPVVVEAGSGESGDTVVVGMLTVAPDGGARDAYALPASRLAAAWPEVLRRVSAGGGGAREATRAPVLGLRGEEALRRALANLGEDWLPANGRWDAEELAELERHVISKWDSPGYPQTRQAIENARAALETIALLRTREDLTTELVRRALFELWVSSPRLSGARASWSTVAEAVEAVAFDHPAGDLNCRPQMAKFVTLLLAPETGQIWMEAAANEADRRHLWIWADSFDRLLLGAAGEFVRNRRGERRLRLVISLHSIAGDWPEELDARLYCDGEFLKGNSFAFDRPGQAGADLALAAAVHWADAEAADISDNLLLRRVDIAAPTALLRAWHYEEIPVGLSKLCENYDVVGHWNQRLNPPQWILREANKRLNNIRDAAAGAPIDWLSRKQVVNPKLRELLKDGEYKRAVGFDHYPDAEFLDLLLSYIPIVLWPRANRNFPASRRACLDRYWDILPMGFLMAYRKELADERDGTDLSCLRVVWDDHEWLRFCRKVAGGQAR